MAAINALKYFNAINATLFTSGVRCPDTKPPRANVASALHRRHGASSLICNFIKVNTNMSHFLFLTLTLQQAPRLLHSPSSFTTDALDQPANESLLSHTAPPHWSRTVTCPTPTCSMTLRTSQYLFNHFIGRSYRPEPLWKHSSVCSFVFKKNTIQQLSKIHAVWSDYSLIYKISFLEEKQTFNRD